MKKAKRVAVPVVEASLPPPYPVVGEEARARFKLQSLMQDYEELLKDIAAKRKKLQREKKKIPKLTAEVKFLRRRYNYLVENPYPTPYKLKTNTQKTPYIRKHKPQKSPAMRIVHPQNPELGRELFQHEKSYREKEVAIPRTSAVLDLNQISLPNGEEAELQAEWGPLQMEKSSKWHSSEGDAAAGDLKLSICRDVGSGTSKPGKRKISWQDQVALRV